MIVGTAGHIDHGKTSLVRALTGVDTDRLKEEKARGITIDLGFAYLPRPSGHTIGFVDVPGHEKFVGTMLAGAHGIDLVLLVIAATEGVMPQTREHLEILDLLGLTRGIVALTKADLVDPDTLALRELEVAEALSNTSLAGAPVMPVSPITGLGITDLLARLDAEAPPPRDLASAFRLAVDRVFTLSGAGTVVTGTVLDGTVALGDQIVVSPAGLAGRIRSMHVQNRPAEIARAGDRAALNLAGAAIARDAIARGDMVLTPAMHDPTRLVDAEIRLLAHPTRWPAQGLPVRLHHAAAECGARMIQLSDTDVQLVLDRPLAVRAHDRFILCDVSQRRTLGGGHLLDPHPPLRARRSEARAAQRDAWRHRGHAEALAALLAEPPHVLPLGRFLADRGIDTPPPSDAVPLRVEAETWLADRVALSALDAAMAATLDDFHVDNPDLAGVTVDRLRAMVARGVPAPVFRALATRLRDQGGIVIDGGWVHRPGHSVVLTPDDEAMWARIEPILLGEVRFRPPRVRDIARVLDLPEDTIRTLLRRLRRAGRVDEIAQDHFFPRAVTGEIARIVFEVSADGWFTAAQLRDRLDNGRKVAIQMLEFLDRHGVTIRRGDLRRANPRQHDLFTPD